MIEESKSVWESNLNSEALTKRGESIRNFATDLQLEVVKMNNSLEIIQSLVSSLIAENVSSWKISGLIKHANLQEIIDKQRKEHDASKYTSSSWRTPSNASYTMTSLSEQLLHNNLYGNGATPVSNMSNMSNMSNETNTPDTTAYQSLEEICSSVASCCAMLELLSLIELQLDYFTFFEILFNNIQLPIEPPENQMNWPIIYFASSACSNALQKLKYIHNNWPKIFCEQEFDYFCDYLQKAITALFNSKDARKRRKKILQQQQPQQVSPQKQTSSTQTQNQTLQNQTLQKQNLQKQNQSLQNQSLQNQGQQQKQQTVQTFHIDPNVSSKNQTNAHIQEIQQTTQTNKKNSSSSQNQIVKMVYLDPNNTSSKNQTNSQIQTQLQQTPTQKQTSTSSQNQQTSTQKQTSTPSQNQQTSTQKQTSTSSQNQTNAHVQDQSQTQQTPQKQTSTSSQNQQTPTQKQTSTPSQNQTNAHIQAQSQTQQTPTQTQTSTSSQNQLNKKLNNDQNKQKRLSKHQQLIIQSQQQQQSQQANSIKFSSNSIKRTPSKVYLNLLNLLYQPPQEQMLQFITVDEHQRECFLEMLQLLSFKRISVEGYYCY